MPIYVRCPHCKFDARTKRERIGTRVRCPGCGHELLIPDRNAEAAEDQDQLEITDDVPEIENVWWMQSSFLWPCAIVFGFVFVVCALLWPKYVLPPVVIGVVIFFGFIWWIRRKPVHVPRPHGSTETVSDKLVKCENCGAMTPEGTNCEYCSSRLPDHDKSDVTHTMSGDPSDQSLHVYIKRDRPTIRETIVYQVYHSRQVRTSSSSSSSGYGCLIKLFLGLITIIIVANYLK